MHRLLSVRLRGDHLEIIGADNGLDGIGMARTRSPDLILLDVDMPEMDGFEVLQTLRDDAATHEIPVIFLAGMTTTEDKVRAFEMGAMDFVSKPPDFAELKARVRSALRISFLMKMLAQKARLDGLTGLGNRAYIDERLNEEFAQSTRHNRSLSLIMSDLDNFKSVNDTYGHPHGDAVLIKFASLLAEGCREGDIACRYGGEEFAVILPETERDDAAEVAERVRASLEAVEWLVHPERRITASFGVASLSCVEAPSIERLVAAADSALYAAKRKGRNRVILAKPEGRRFSLSA